MQSTNFTTKFTVKQAHTEVYEAINNVRKWWTGEIEGTADQVGDEFSYRYHEAHYSKQRVTELVPGQKIVWHVVDSLLDGPEDPSEWTGTDIIFEISSTGDGTEIRF